MPKAGYKSLTVTETTFNLWEHAYHKNKTELAKFGINSFSGYVNAIMYGVISDSDLQVEAAKKFQEMKLRS